MGEADSWWSSQLTFSNFLAVSSVDVVVIIWIAFSTSVLVSKAIVVFVVIPDVFAIASSGASFQAGFWGSSVWGFVVPVADTVHAGVSSVTENLWFCWSSCCFGGVDVVVIVWIAFSTSVLVSKAIVVLVVVSNIFAIASSGTSVQAGFGGSCVWGFVVPVADTVHAGVSSVTEYLWFSWFCWSCCCFGGVDVIMIICNTFSTVVFVSKALVVFIVEPNEFAIASSGASVQAALGGFYVWSFVVPVADTVHASESSITENLWPCWFCYWLWWFVGLNHAFPSAFWRLLFVEIIVPVNIVIERVTLWEKETFSVLT